MQRLVLCLSQFGLAACAHALSLQLDYSYDAANGNFFGLNPTAKAAVDAAAADIGNAILPSLGAIPTDTFNGTNGQTNVTIDWKVTFSNPSTGATVTLQTFTRLADDIVIYVGMRPLLGPTLGQGGPGGAGINLSGSGLPAQWVGAVNNAQSASNAVMPRDGGPIVGSLRGSSTFGTATANYDLKYGAILGNLWLDSDSNNDGTVDSASLLDSYWHYDHTSAVAAGQNDMYSVALHELIHSIGFGSSESWTSLVSGTTWLGAQATQLNGGSGTNLVSPDGAHIASGLMSPRLSDSVMQEAVMDPTLTAGTRKSLTQLDLAFLRDLGYATIPEPSVAALASLGAVLLWRRRRREYLGNNVAQTSRLHWI